MPDIVDTAMSSGIFNILVEGVIGTELVDTLKGPGPFTVFAPTDDALAQIPKNDFKMLLKTQLSSRMF